MYYLQKGSWFDLLFVGVMGVSPKEIGPSQAFSATQLTNYPVMNPEIDHDHVCTLVSHSNPSPLLAGDR